MTLIDWLEMSLIVVNGLIILTKLYQAGVDLIKAKQWDKLMNVMLNLMVEAEKQFVEGAAKKAWVMNELRVAAKSLDYDYDAVAEQKVSEMIDAICDASKELQKKVQ